MRIRAAVVLVLLARSAWAAPQPGPSPTKPPAPAPDFPVPVEEQPKPEAEPPPAPAEAPKPGPTAPAGVTKPPAQMILENSLLLDQARMARDAARSGHCEIVLELAPKVRAIDPTFHDQLFALDPLIGACVNPGAFPRAVLPRRMEFVLREVRAEPPPSVGRVSGEILLGMVVGAGGALIGALLGGGVCVGGGDGEGCDASLIGGAYVGAVLTIPLGVRAVGNSGDQIGSLGMTYLGSLIGGVGGLLMLANGRENISILGMVFAPPIGAMIGFNATRRYRPRRVPVTGALLQWSDGTASLGVPIPTRLRTEDRTVTSIPLLGGTF